MENGDRGGRPTCRECVYYDSADAKCHVEPATWREIEPVDVACSSFMAMWHAEGNREINKAVLELKKAEMEQALRATGRGNNIAPAKIVPNIFGGPKR